MQERRTQFRWFHFLSHFLYQHTGQSEMPCCQRTMEINRTEPVRSISTAAALLWMEVNSHRESLPPLKSNPLVRPCRTPSLGTIRAVADRGNNFPHIKSEVKKRDMIFTATCRLETVCGSTQNENRLHHNYKLSVGDATTTNCVIKT